jgi:hypothetical protein
VQLQRQRLSWQKLKQLQERQRLAEAIMAVAEAAAREAEVAEAEAQAAQAFAEAALLTLKNRNASKLV